MKRGAIFCLYILTAGLFCADEKISILLNLYADHAFLKYSGILFVFLVVVLVSFVHVLRREVANKTGALNEHIGRLESSEQRNKAFILALPDLFFIIDRNGIYVDGTTSDPELLKVPAASLIGKNIAEIFNPELVHKFMDAILQVLDHGGIGQFEYELEVPAGLRHFECRIVAMDDTKALYITRDVTDRFLREQEILRSLHEKEVLLKEVHHRVKNNLQVISSLVSLQADMFNNDDDRSLMQETQQRIQSMAQLYEMLYQTGDFLSINLKKYLSRIIDELVIANHTVSGQIRIENRIDDLCASLELAMPLGLIVNELVSNSLKHGFTGAQTGTITITLVHGGSTITLTVLDDGCGMPPDIRIDKPVSLGFILVQSLVRQVGGSLSVLPEPGTGFRVVIPDNQLR